MEENMLPEECTMNIIHQLQGHSKGFGYIKATLQIASH